MVPGTDDRVANPDDLFERARALTKDEAESEKYSIFDIFLTTSGYDILYHSNEIGKFYEEFIDSEKDDGLDPSQLVPLSHGGDEIEKLLVVFCLRLW